MKLLDNIFRTIVGIAPELDGKEAIKIREYIELLLEDEGNSYKKRIRELETENERLKGLLCGMTAAAESLSMDVMALEKDDE